MRRWLVLPALAALALGACGDGDDLEGADDEQQVVTEVDQAVEIAKLSLPAALGDDVVADLIEDLCAAAGTGDVDAVVAQLRGAALDPAAIEAIAAGAGTYCDDDVDAVVPQVQQALTPAPTSTVAPVAAASSGGTGSSSRSSSASGGSARGGSAPSASAGTTSSGSASVGGGDANGTGNQSSTGFTQGVSSSNSSSSSGSSNSSSSTTG